MRVPRRDFSRIPVWTSAVDTPIPIIAQFIIDNPILELRNSSDLADWQQRWIHGRSGPRVAKSAS